MDALDSASAAWLIQGFYSINSKIFLKNPEKFWLSPLYLEKILFDRVLLPMARNL